ncbi:hypothetical protein [Turneriella parva]|uniref:Class I SAM-dependent methyltransferase n=1 Tax=Turneriella parva (strain ATCC BAA-1111 / DSM 21527 / NCTC 11395 / H) TaxID=869212 RepID=I4BAF4_TURPD|nr:hypothetical protein [Turneriella parva]AFM14261.1 hypothetical protein Turpa_3627 [Turneriella parva DSM 21527]
MLTLPARIDTFESHELSWVPDDLKVLFREILSWTQDIGGVYATALPIVRRWFEATGAEGILDLCSGAGGPGVTLLNAMRADNLKVKMKLTDLYPANEVYANLKLQYPGILEFESASTDATNSRRDADYPVRSLLSAFHQFSPNLARKILIDAAKNSDGICIMDPFQRDLWHLMSVPIGATLSTQIYPLLRQRTPFAFAMCNLTPVIPSMFFWDSIASVLRGYTPDELLSLADVPECRSFVWQAGTWNYLPGTGLSGVYLIGRRK